MKRLYTFTSLLALCLLSSFKPSTSCDYAGSNLGFAMEQTEKAISENNLNKLRFFAYKAINAFEKSKGDLDKCRCKDADELVSDGKDALIEAVRTSSLSKAKELLRKALDDTYKGIKALANHEPHENKYPDNVLAMNTVDGNGKMISEEIKTESILHQKIDASLVDYEVSLNEIVLSVNCEDARAFATRVYKECEAELLKPNLSEGKKYYNLRTKEITAEALKKLADCN